MIGIEGVRYCQPIDAMIGRLIAGLILVALASKLQTFIVTGCNISCALKVINYSHSCAMFGKEV